MPGPSTLPGVLGRVWTREREGINSRRKGKEAEFKDADWSKKGKMVAWGSIQIRGLGSRMAGCGDGGRGRAAAWGVGTGAGG